MFQRGDDWMRQIFQSKYTITICIKCNFFGAKSYWYWCLNLKYKKCEKINLRPEELLIIALSFDNTAQIFHVLFRSLHNLYFFSRNKHLVNHLPCNSCCPVELYCNLYRQVFRIVNYQLSEKNHRHLVQKII